MKPHRKLVSFVTALALVCLLPACKLFQGDQGTVVLSAVVYNATSIGVYYDVKANAENKAAYETAVQVLNRLINDGQYDYIAFQKALQALPISTFRGSDGALIVQAVISVYDVATGSFVDLNQQSPMLKAVMIATRDGLKRGLALAANPTAVGAPVQCTVPSRSR